MITLKELSKTEALRYMGIHKGTDKFACELLDKYEPVVRKALRPAYVYREANIEFGGDGIRLSGFPAILTGKSIRLHLDGCDRAVILGATVSSEADRLIRTVSITDMAGALAVDCLCSTAIEQVCDSAEEEIFSAVKAEYRTSRFSAGYGDLPIELQPDILKYLNAQRRIGLTCTESCMLTPTKSVTAIIGIR